MSVRKIRLVLPFLFLAPAARGSGIEVVPMVGYQLNGSRDLAGPRDTHIDFHDKALIGLSVGRLLKDDGEVELSWTRTNASVDVDRAAGGPPDHFGVRIDRIHFNMMYMSEPPPVQPFVLIGLGATRFSPTGDRSSDTRFSFALGGGFKWLWNDHIGLRFDGRWTPTFLPSGSQLFCDPAGECNTIQSNSYLTHALPYLNSFEFTTGLMLRY